VKEPERPQGRPLVAELLEDDFDARRRTLLLAMALRHPHTARWPDAQRDGQPVNARASLRRALPLGGYQATAPRLRAGGDPRTPEGAREPLAATPPREEG
jgi:hypothetical protein